MNSIKAVSNPLISSDQNNTSRSAKLSQHFYFHHKKNEDLKYAQGGVYFDDFFYWSLNIRYQLNLF